MRMHWHTLTPHTVCPHTQRLRTHVTEATLACQLEPSMGDELHEVLNGRSFSIIPKARMLTIKGARLCEHSSTHASAQGACARLRACPSLKAVWLHTAGA